MGDSFLFRYEVLSQLCVEYLQIEYYITVAIDISSKGESYEWFGWFGKDAS